MKIAFYSPMKPITHPNPSGDREIARGLHSFLSQGAEVFVLSEFRSRFFFRSPMRIILWVMALVSAYRLARREKPDLYFTYHTYYKAPDAIGFLLALWFGKPYFVFEGIYGRTKARLGLNLIGYWFNRAALVSARRIYSDKSADFESLEKWFPGKSTYIPPSLEVSAYTQAKGNELPVIATVAMLRPGRKSDGVRFLIRSLANLRREGFDFHWRIAGGGECLEEVKALARDSLGDQAEFLGATDAVPELLAGADFFAFPGIGEGFGLAYAEAQASGLPVVAFYGDGSKDVVIEGKTGFLTPSMDEAAYTSALRQLIENPALRRQMGEAARRQAIRFDRDRNYSVLLADLKLTSRK